MATKVWWQESPELVDEIRSTLVGPYATLVLKACDEGFVVSGYFPLLHEGEPLDTYEIEISFPPAYPDDPPTVRETAGRIPHMAERHNSSGAACLFVPFEWKLLRPDLSFRTFLEEPVRSYFLGQSLVELGEPWPIGERAHGIDGIIEALRDRLGLDTVEHAVGAFRMLTKAQVKGHWDCFCGSGNRLRSCHGAALHAIHNENTARWARKIISDFFLAKREAERLAADLHHRRQQIGENLRAQQTA